VSTAERTAGLCLPLESGDRLNRDEFERRYSTRPDIKKAELIEGVVYVGSPVRIPQHAEPHAHMVFWLTTYRSRHSGCRVADNGTVRLDAENEPQPDVMLFKEGSLSRLDEYGYLEGAPDLVVEISASSASYDLGAKKEAYRRAGVREYIVWQILEERIDWFRLENGAYALVAPGADSLIESVAFPGLRLNTSAMLSGDLSAVVAVIS